MTSRGLLGVCGLELEGNQDLGQLEGLAPLPRPLCLCLTSNSPNQKISLSSEKIDPDEVDLTPSLIK